MPHHQHQISICISSQSLAYSRQRIILADFSSFSFFPASGYSSIFTLSCHAPGTLNIGEEKDINNQGLKKKLLKEGESWETRENGDEVEVHYTGTLLDETQFDSSHDRGTPFQFTLCQGQVIKGWDHGIKTKKNDENAIFIIPVELAYGAYGSPFMRKYVV
ncbi:unnamed protein product [Lactuca virosa]|uniref:peptidylprolyl isomerase n=1 Tax=Lactuca virosa TaxID=75947 RepID=A0AAU9M9D8_9ASTR|nr:unnamed protein product [Lactuca virosa]